MNKQEFILNFKNKLAGLPQNEIDERTLFYCEMIDDKLEEGFTEEEAVSSIGSIDKIYLDIITEVPLTKLVKEKVKPKRKMNVLEIILLVLGSPLWLSLAIVLIAITLSIYVILWSVIISLWSVFASLIASGIGCIIAGVIIAFQNYSLAGIVTITGGLILTGLSIFAFFACKTASKGLIVLTKRVFIQIKRKFLRKDDNQ